MSTPTLDVLEAFGLTGAPQPLAGGRGLCYRVGNSVLKPSEDDVEVQWISQLAVSLLERAPTSYTLATPLPVVGQPGNYVFRGWSATMFADGTIDHGNRFRDILRLSRAFHADLAEVVRNRPGAISRQPNRWNLADRVTWGEAALDEIEGVNKEWLGKVQPLLDRLALVRRPLPEKVPNQVIHGDITGNILWTDRAAGPPTIIDLTLYWRPAEYSSAIAVADGLAWSGQGRELVELYGTDDIRLQLLVRALYWRILTFAIDTDLEWVQEFFPRSNYPGAIEVLGTFLSNAPDHVKE